MGHPLGEDPGPRAPLAPNAGAALALGDRALLAPPALEDELPLELEVDWLDALDFVDPAELRLDTRVLAVGTATAVTARPVVPADDDCEYAGPVDADAT